MAGSGSPQAGLIRELGCHNDGFGTDEPLGSWAPQLWVGLEVGWPLSPSSLQLPLCGTLCLGRHSPGPHVLDPRKVKTDYCQDKQGGWKPRLPCGVS